MLLGREARRNGSPRRSHLLGRSVIFLKLMRVLPRENEFQDQEKSDASYDKESQRQTARIEEKRGQSGNDSQEFRDLSPNQ